MFVTTTTTYGRPQVKPYIEKALDPLLLELLGRVTPHGTEAAIRNIIKSKSFLKYHDVKEIDENLIIKVGDSKTIFSCHMDTVSENTSADNSKLDRIRMMTPDTDDLKFKDYIYGSKVYVNKETKEIEYRPSTLGADDKLGVYICMKMIEKNIPGMYLFHVGEELGGIGSGKLSRNHKDLFEGYQRAIAFDRADYGDIICFQRGGRCCSEKFGKELAARLNVYMPAYQHFNSEVRGTFTDTANYTSLVPECTNISVGYFHQHGTNENFDYLWLKEYLLPAVLEIDYEDLVVDRDPKHVAPSVYYSNRHWSNYCSDEYEYPDNYFNKNWNNFGNSNSDLQAHTESWATANKNTPYLNRPIWEPRLGYIEEADPEALLMAIQVYFRRCRYDPQQQDKLAEYFFNALEDRHELLQEVIELSKENTFLRSQLKIVPNKDVEDKKTLLRQLIAYASDGELTLTDNDAIKRLMGYVLGAQKILSNPKKEYNQKDLKKMNRIIFNMAYIISLDQREHKPEHMKNFLLAVHTYITERITEEGFNAPVLH